MVVYAFGASIQLDGLRLLGVEWWHRGKKTSGLEVMMYFLRYPIGLPSTALVFFLFLYFGFVGVVGLWLLDGRDFESTPL